MGNLLCALEQRIHQKRLGRRELKADKGNGGKLHKHFCDLHFFYRPVQRIVLYGGQPEDSIDALSDQGFNNGTGLGGDGNYAEGVQTGNNNTLTINQNATTSGSGNRAVINQIGDGFELTIDQEGSGMINEITQI